MPPIWILQNTILLKQQILSKFNSKIINYRAKQAFYEYNLKQLLMAHLIKGIKLNNEEYQQFQSFFIIFRGKAYGKTKYYAGPIYITL